MCKIVKLEEHTCMLVLKYFDCIQSYKYKYQWKGKYREKHRHFLATASIAMVEYYCLT